VPGRCSGWRDGSNQAEIQGCKSARRHAGLFQSVPGSCRLDGGPLPVTHHALEPVGTVWCGAKV